MQLGLIQLTICVLLNNASAIHRADGLAGPCSQWPAHQQSCLSQNGRRVPRGRLGGRRSVWIRGDLWALASFFGRRGQDLGYYCLATSNKHLRRTRPSKPPRNSTAGSQGTPLLLSLGAESSGARGRRCSELSSPPKLSVAVRNSKLRRSKLSHSSWPQWPRDRISRTPNTSALWATNTSGRRLRMRIGRDKADQPLGASQTRAAYAVRVRLRSRRRRCCWTLCMGAFGWRPNRVGADPQAVHFPPTDAVHHTPLSSSPHSAPDASDKEHFTGSHRFALRLTPPACFESPLLAHCGKRRVVDMQLPSLGSRPPRLPLQPRIAV